MSALSSTQHYLRSARCLAYAARAAYQDDPLKDPKFKGLGFTNATIATFKSRPGDKSDTQGFVAHDADNVVLSFRGTEPKKVSDWITDLKLAYYDKKVSGGNVHEGFWEAWLSVKAQVNTLLKNALTNNQTVWVTGHSLGGALATLASRDLPAKFKPNATHTFGAPRSGSPDYAKDYNKGVNLYRFVNEDDIVPHVPLQGSFSRLKYSHVGKAQLFRSDGTVTSSGKEWNRLLRNLAKVLIFGAAAIPKKGIGDHSMNNYIAKLENHGSNKKR